MSMDPTLLPAGTAIDLGIGRSTVLPSMDFETYSEAGYVHDPVTGKIRGLGTGGKGGLPAVGTPAYAAHPSTEVLCLYYDLKDGKGRQGWFPGTPQPVDLLNYVAGGGPIEAFNITFEWWVWNMVCVKRYGWPPLPLDQCYCVMARSRRHSLPGALAKVSKVLGTPEKDKAGGNLIGKLCRPLTPTKKRPAIRWTPATNWPDFLSLYGYCDQDVVAEDHVAARIPDLTQYERDWWLLDQTINVRGVQVDMPALDAAISILEQATRKYTIELAQVTAGAVGSVSEVAKLGKWLRDQYVYLPDMQAETVTAWLKRDDLPPDARRVLEIRDCLSSANVKKLATLKLQTSSDGRLRDQYMCWGADRTGRWSAGGVQLQNLTAKGPKTDECGDCGAIFGRVGFIACPHCGSTRLTPRPEWTVEAVEYALEDILSRDLSQVERMWGDPIAVLCGCLRGLFIAKEGHDLICCDFSAIEAVAAACLSRCQWRIDVFNTHGKIYEQSAAKISGISFEEMMACAGYIDLNKQEWWLEKQTGSHHKLRKTLGKVSELASAYGGWINAWIAFGADKFMNEAEMKSAILKWRAESPEIIEMWGGQFRQTGPRLSDGHAELYGLEGAVVAAIQNPGQCFSYIDITYGVWNDILHCRLPSGRFLHYHRPKLVLTDGKWGKPDAYQITFEGYNSNATKGPVGWSVMDTFGGRLFENVVQAVSADIQSLALQRCEANGYPIVMHTHDEGSAEVPEGQGSIEEMEGLLSQRPEWASWWPLRAAGWRHRRYQKD